MTFNPNTDLPNEWRAVTTRSGFFSSAAATNTYIIGFAASVGAGAVGGASTGLCAFWFDPADHQVAARTTQIRIRGELITNAVAPGASTVFTFGMFPVSTWGGTSTNVPTVATAGSVVLTCPTINAPTADTASHTEATPVTAPSAGFYVLTCQLSGAAAAVGALEVLLVELQVRCL